MDGRCFPVHPHSMRDEKWFPRSIPWAAAESFRAQAERNHGQTLERLAERGGLSPEEMLFAHQGKRLSFGDLTPELHIEALSLVVRLQRAVL
jgi:hypothetical protein